MNLTNIDKGVSSKSEQVSEKPSLEATEESEEADRWEDSWDENEDEGEEEERDDFELGELDESEEEKQGYELYCTMNHFKLRALAASRRNAQIDYKVPTVTVIKQMMAYGLETKDWAKWRLHNKLFEYFSDLPVEIQSMIWEYTLPGPRIMNATHRMDTERIPLCTSLLFTRAKITCTFSLSLLFSLYSSCFQHSTISCSWLTISLSSSHAFPAT